MAVAVEGRRRFRGILLGAEGGVARIQSQDAAEDEDKDAQPGENAQPSREILLPIEDMAEAKLVLTDALITESLRRSKATERTASGERDSRWSKPTSRHNENFRRGSAHAQVPAQDEGE
jgi:ribosome maturation factor RimP